MNIIVAVDENWGIGKNGDLLMHLSGDMRFFKKMTLGKIVVMGRKTLESLPNSKPLPHRRNIVLSKSLNYEVENVEIMTSIEDVISFSNCLEKQRLIECEKHSQQVDRNIFWENNEKESENSSEIFVIGGAQIYERLLPYCDKCYVTKIHSTLDADVFFPNIDDNKMFQLVDESDEIEEKGITYTFCTYNRV